MDVGSRASGSFWIRASVAADSSINIKMFLIRGKQSASPLLAVRHSQQSTSHSQMIIFSIIYSSIIHKSCSMLQMGMFGVWTNSGYLWLIIISLSDRHRPFVFHHLPPTLTLIMIYASIFKSNLSSDISDSPP